MINLDKNKYKNTILFLCKHLGGTIEGKKKLAKLLYFIDFDSFEYKESMHSVTGDSYVAWKMGPVPSNFKTVLDEMEKDKMLKINIKEIGDDYNSMETYTSSFIGTSQNDEILYELSLYRETDFK